MISTRSTCKNCDSASFWILVRKHTNEMTRLAFAMVRFGVERKGIDARMWNDLKAVKNLHKGKPLFTSSGQVVMRDGLPIIPVEGRIAPPVDDATFERTLEYLPEVVADMARFQCYTGCRPGEVCSIRPRDVDRSEAIWLYRPESYKTEHHETDSRVIAIGERAQAILSRYLLRDEDSFCFSPAESEKRRRQRRTELRVTPASCGNSPGSNRKEDPQKAPANRYTSESYYRAIYRAVGRANKHAEAGGLPVFDRWSPNQLRKAHALEVRENPELGLDHVMGAMGHQKRDTTERYYARLVANEKAIDVATKIG